MKKRYLIWIVFVITLIGQPVSWFTPMVAQAAPLDQNVIKLAENPQMIALNEDIQLFAATGFGGLEIKPWFWALSILIPGLGQFLMGDILKGTIFFLTPVLLAAAWGGLTLLLATSSPQIWGPTNVILPLFLLGVWTWNIFDAYYLNQGSETQAQNAFLQTVQPLSESSIMSANDSSLSLNARLLTF